jgi:FAD/FMN-containing dehydrogenase
MENQFSPARDAATSAGFRLNSVQQTFVIPAKRTDDDPDGISRTTRFLDAVRPTLFDEPDAPSFLDAMRPTLIDVLFLPADDILLSAGRGTDGYAVTLSFTRRDGEGWDVLRSRLRELSKRCVELGGRVHLVKNVEVDPDDLDEMYGEAFDRFLAIKARVDPRGSIRNEFFDRIFRADRRKLV